MSKLLQLSIMFLSLFIFYLSALSGSAHAQENKGKFIGELILKFLKNGRDMELVKKYSYKDSGGKIWNVPKGTIVNGASIPRPLWGIIGGPYEGKYRDASVIHDYNCEIKSKPWGEVHKVFFDAMLASGVNWSKARLMYTAVYRFGPRWEKGTRSKKVCTEEKNGVCTSWKNQLEIIEVNPKFIKEDFEALLKSAENKDLTLKDLEALADSNLKQRTMADFD